MAVKKKKAEKPKKRAAKRPVSAPSKRPKSATSRPKTAVKRPAPKKQPVITAAQKRSNAAKKGWATRRKNETVRKIKKKTSDNQKKLRNAALVLGKKPPPKKTRTTAKTTKKELEAINREIAAKLAQAERDLARERLTKDWVPAVDDQFLSRSGHIALEPSRARHDPDYEAMRERLEAARAESEYDFDAECYDIAMDYGYEVREIYTMFWSP